MRGDGRATLIAPSASDLGLAAGEFCLYESSRAATLIDDPDAALFDALQPHLKGLDALVPQPPPPNAPKNQSNDRTIVVQVIDKGPGQTPGLKINQDDATWDSLQGRLTDIFKTRAEKVMFVKGDDNIPFADVANVIDIAHASGVDKVGLITAKIEAGG